MFSQSIFRRFDLFRVPSLAYSGSEALPQSALELPLATSLVPSVGTGILTHTRATSAWMWRDSDGRMWRDYAAGRTLIECPAGELRFEGARKEIWTARTSAANNSWLSVCWSPELSLFVAISNSGTNNRVMTSSDGINWTARTSAADTNWMSVCWSPELSLFVAVATTGVGNRVMTSPDGINWTARTSAADNSWNSVCWSPELSLFVAVSYSGAGNRVMTSPDGINWTARTSAADNGWLSVCWSPELSLFVAVATTGVGNRVMTSPDGINWTARTSAANNNWRSVCWSPELSLFVAVSASGIGNRVMTSPDGINWTLCTSAADNGWLSVCWSPELSLFVAVANTGTGNRVMTSPDGINWTLRTSAADNNWNSVCWSPELSLFVAVANSGTNNRVMTFNASPERSEFDYYDTLLDGTPIPANEIAAVVEPQATNLLLNSDVLVTQSVTTTAQTYTLSFRGTGSVALSGTATGTLAGTGEHNRVQLTFTATAGTLTLTVTGSVTTAVLRAGAVAGTYIPTKTTTVTRNADVLTLTGYSVPDTAGTLYFEASATDWSQPSGQLFGDGTEYLLKPITDHSGIEAFDGTNTAQGPAGTPSGTMKFAIRWNSVTGKMRIAANGQLGAEVNYDGSWNLASHLLAYDFAGTVRNFRTWEAAMSDARLTEITA